jgi:hypothetical protein
LERSAGFVKPRRWPCPSGAPIRRNVDPAAFSRTIADFSSDPQSEPAAICALRETTNVSGPPRPPVCGLVRPPDAC